MKKVQSLKGARLSSAVRDTIATYVDEFGLSALSEIEHGSWLSEAHAIDGVGTWPEYLSEIRLQLSSWK